MCTFTIWVHLRALTFPSLFMHCPQCIIYTCTTKFFRWSKNMRVLLLHGILVLPCCIFKTITNPLDFYQPYHSHIEHIEFPIQYAHRLNSEVSFLLHLPLQSYETEIQLSYFPRLHRSLACFYPCIQLY
jgi:hypothetical protein